jgi:hypothetical protein
MTKEAKSSDYSGISVSRVLYAGDCCKKDACERCFLRDETRCTDILIALLTDKLRACGKSGGRGRGSEASENNAKP